MGLKDAYHDLAANQVMAPIVCSNDATGNVSNSVDLTGYMGGLIGVQTGVEGDLFDGSNYFTIKWQISNDANNDFAAPADADLIGGTNTQVIDANAETPALHVRAYVGQARYFRAIIDVTGTHATGTPASAFAVRFKPHRA